MQYCYLELLIYRIAILLMTNQMDETSSVITINGYGLQQFFFILIIAFS